ncbi:alpha/beta hydrolase family protein [Shimia isoporae]|uniref:Alpha/beta hydrolase family protein n=1 Tax=Shimia isoporae TaxID=647720 RepID=A0A4V2Q274_9RHOB|nr:alpha/beta hydrolase [Shimia isoporae]TCL01331.1 alpha/beta hydrolase family protein [Shimia isoporae]
MDWDDAYANAAYIDGADAYPDRWASEGAAFRAATGARVDVSYGQGAREVYDLILPEGAPKGLFVFVHGGYWLRFDKSFWSAFARGARALGWAVAMPSYELAPNARISEITMQVAAAIEHAAGEIDGPIILAGHSAGGHLVARAVCQGVLPDAVADRIVRSVPISPVSDLRPMMKTSMNADLKLDEAECQAESPALLQPRSGIEVTVVVGAAERPVFLDQAEWLSTAWNCDRIIVGGKHHFDVIDALADPESDLCKAMFV